VQTVIRALVSDPSPVLHSPALGFGAARTECEMSAVGMREVRVAWPPLVPWFELCGRCWPEMATAGTTVSGLVL
jgi:hypothetical protein